MRRESSSNSRCRPGQASNGRSFPRGDRRRIHDFISRIDQLERDRSAGGDIDGPGVRRHLRTKLSKVLQRGGGRTSTWDDGEAVGTGSAGPRNESWLAHYQACGSVDLEAENGGAEGSDGDEVLEQHGVCVVEGRRKVDWL